MRKYEALPPEVVAKLYKEDRKTRKEIMDFLVYAFSRGMKIPKDVI